MSVTLMIIDNDAVERESFSDAAYEVDESIHCIPAQTVNEAFLLLNDDDTPLPDFIFLSLDQPRNHGKQCLAKLKVTPELCDIPVIAYTNLFSDRVIEEAQNLGAVVVIRKPAGHVGLMNAIEHVIHKHWQLSAAH